MTETAAPSEPAAVAPGAVAPVQSEKRMLLTLAAGLPALGALIQFFVAPGPLVAVVTTVGLSLALVAAGQAARGELRRTLGGFRLAAVVLAALAGAAALGTLLLQNRPEQFYREQFPRGANLIVGLGLNDIFHSVWFSVLLALMVAGLVTSAIARWPITLRNAGFFAVHLGTVVVLAGAGLSALFAVKGRIDLKVGDGPVSMVSVVRNGVETGEVVPLGGSVELLDFAVDRYKTTWRMALYAPSKAKGWELSTSFDARAGRSQKLGGGASHTVKTVYPDYYLAENAVPVETQGAPALQVTLDGRERWLAAGDQERLESADGRLLILFGPQRPALPPAQPTHSLQVDGAAPQRIEVGGTLTLADGRVGKVLRVQPHFTYDIEKKEARSLSDQPMNPALELELGEGGPRRFLFARMAGHHDHGDAAGALVYSFTPAQSFETVLSIGADERTVLVSRGGKDETLPLAEGLELAGARFGQLLAQARIERSPATRSQELRNPAVLVEVTEAGEARQTLMVAENQDAVRLANGNVLTYEQSGEAVKTFRSHVRVREGGSEREARLVVNDPLTLGRWQLYQANFRADDPDYSGLDAVRDPGVGWVFTGFGLMFFGVVYMTYVQPRLRRRKEA
jgi:hypothetical protein